MRCNFLGLQCLISTGEESLEVLNGLSLFCLGANIPTNLQSFALPGMSMPHLPNISFANRHTLPAEFTPAGNTLPSGENIRSITVLYQMNFDVCRY